MRIYLAGPMRGIPQHNFPAFDAAQLAFELKGWEVVSPAAMNREEGFDGDYELDEVEMRGIFANDFHNLCFCDAIALLPGWQHSTGAKIELSIACALDIEIIMMKVGGKVPSAKDYTHAGIGNS